MTATCKTTLLPAKHGETSIRKTLQATKAATWAVVLEVPGSGPVPAGSGFLIDENGLFATAAHVVAERPPITVIKASGSADDAYMLEVREVVFLDKDADFALLRVAPHTAHGTVALPSPLKLGVRELEEGEPVYAYGYPLTMYAEPFRFSLQELRALGLPVEEIVGSDGRKLTEMGPWAKVGPSRS